MNIFKIFFAFLSRKNNLDKLNKKSIVFTKKQIDEITNIKVENNIIRELKLKLKDEQKQSVEQIFDWLKVKLTPLIKIPYEQRIKFLWENRYIISSLSYEDYLAWEGMLVSQEFELTQASNTLLYFTIIKAQASLDNEQALAENLEGDPFFIKLDKKTIH